MPNMKNLRIAAPYYRPYWISFSIGLLIVLASSAITSVIPWLLRRAIDAIGNGAPMRSIWQLSGLIVLAAIVGGAFRYGMRELMNGVSRWIEYDLRNDLFTHLETLDPAYFAQTRTGDIMARLTNDLSAVRMAVGPAVMYLANTVAGGLFALYFMLRIDVKLTLLALMPLIVLPLLTIKMGKAIHDRFEAVQEHFSTLTTRAQENLTGARIVRAYRQEAAEIARFGAINEQYLTLNMSLVRLWGTLNPLFAFFGGLGAVIVLGAGGVLAIRGTISIGAFVAFGMYLTMLTWPMIALGWVVNLFQRGDASMGRLAEILEAKPAIVPAEPRRHLPETNTGRTIEFRSVGFHYPGGVDAEPRWVLRDVSFTVPAGSTLGVVGATGSGKSALIDLIPRMYDPQEGEILIDGVPTRNVPPHELREEIGFVPQESLLFSDTIGSNLSYGTGAISQTGEWAASVAQLDRTIQEFPGGYETILGERGINLSGGQKQRASLARALARKPSIVLLDDALSAVDTHTEAEILRALREALSGRTALIASHRISAIRDASWIIVLEKGRMVEQGRHPELMALRGRYWSLLRRQQLLDAVESDAVESDAVESDAVESDTAASDALATDEPATTI
jgi:ATP-binding cassette, subfamily B, multidrug efflux pump